MKIGVILCLAAGPLVVRAQQPGRGHAPMPDNVFGWKPPKVELRAFSQPVKPAPAVQFLMPDRMCCLMAAGADPMPVDRRRGRDAMPNGMRGLPRLKIVTTVR
jgi:hypothetical protein